jgi:hypothetical protein
VVHTNISIHFASPYSRKHCSLSAFLSFQSPIKRGAASQVGLAGWRKVQATSFADRLRIPDGDSRHHSGAVNGYSRAFSKGSTGLVKGAARDQDGSVHSRG